jgi:hypothetical protein
MTPCEITLISDTHDLSPCKHPFSHMAVDIRKNTGFLATCGFFQLLVRSCLIPLRRLTKMQRC